MHPTLVACSKASRRALTPKRGNKDFYKGTGQSRFPGVGRTGAPGKHVISGHAKYRLLDEKVRVFVAPNIKDIENSPLKAYVALDVRLSPEQKHEVYGPLPLGGMTPELYLRRFKESSVPKLTEAERETMSMIEGDASTTEVVPTTQ